MLLQEGDVITGKAGTYQVQGKIGSESTFGAVFRALDQEGEPVVIKQLLGPDQITRDTGMDYAYARVTFEREAAILLQHQHPRVVQGLDFFERDEDLVLVMEFINGEDLDQMLVQRIDEQGPFSEQEAVAIGVALCEVIHGLHQLPGQILYRDLKARNVLWDAANGMIKLIDFGTARFMEDRLQATRALGTPGYAPPELYTTQSHLSFASDVYTIGSTLYELVTGQVPEALMTPSHFHGYERQLSENFRKNIQKAMAQNPRRRFQTAEEMGQALSSFCPNVAEAKLSSLPANPFPYLSCLCPGCGAQPRHQKSIYCGLCGEKIHVMLLRILANDAKAPSMDLFLDKSRNLIGRMDMEEAVYPDVDLSRYDPDCFVSRRHCILTREQTRFFLEPLNTTNPTTIDGREIAAGKREISPNAVIGLANLSLRLVIKPCVS